INWIWRSSGFVSLVLHLQSVQQGRLTTMTKLFVRFLKDDAGATAIEYGLIAAGISVAIITVAAGLRSKPNRTITSVPTALPSFRGPQSLDEQKPGLEPGFSLACASKASGADPTGPAANIRFASIAT